MNANLVVKWEEVLRSRYWDELLKLADSYPNERSLIIRFSDLDKYDPDLAKELIENPEQILGAAKAALLDIDLPRDINLDQAHVRIIGLPKCFKIKQLGSNQIDKLIALEGQVITTAETRPKRVSSVAFQCVRCGYIFFIELPGSDSEELNVKCQNQACGSRGPFKPLLSNNKYVQAQMIRVQELPEGLKEGEQPQFLDIELEDDLTGKVYPGDRVIVNGVLKFSQSDSPMSKRTYRCISLENKGVGV